MKTILVLGPQGALAEAMRSLLDANLFRVLAHTEVWEAESLLRQGFIELCVVDAELTSIEPIRVIEQLRHVAPACPILVYAGDQRHEWEEEAYLLGVAHVLSKPVRGRVLRALLQRMWPTPSPATPSVAPAWTPPEERPAGNGGASNPRQTLEVLHNFSSILCHSLNSEALLRHFLLLLREIIGINRAAIFLRPPPPSLTAAASGLGDRRMHVACAIGIAPGLLEHFDLSLDGGIGGEVFRHGHILRMQGDEARRDREIQKEFELLGAEVAIPIWDRESLVGVAVFDSRITGEPFSSEELSLIFLLLEQLGLAIKNTWLHDQLSANHQIMMDILNQTGSGCVVVGRNLEVLHANQAAQVMFSRAKGRPPGRFEFSDMPQPLASRIFEVLKTNQPHPPFKFRPGDGAVKVFQVNISLFQRQTAGIPNAVLVTIEDVTDNERAQELEIHSANLKLLKTMASQLAHEIGNSLVPLSTHQQLLASKMEDPEFCQSLTGVMADGVKRIGRLSNQMLYLAMEDFERFDLVSMRDLVEESFAEAQANYGDHKARLMLQEETPTPPLMANQRALKHALSEIMLNSLQADPKDPLVRVRCRAEHPDKGEPRLVLDLQDDGGGFSPEAARRAFEPFYTSRSVGLGLGLTVAGKIVENHRGRIEIVAAPGTPRGTVRLSLPLVRIKEPGGLDRQTLNEVLRS